MTHFKVACYVLLLTWCSSAAPPGLKVSRRYPVSEDELDINSSATSTRRILSKVSTFMQKLSDLTNDMDSLTPQQALALLPEFVVEAVKLRGELDTNPVKGEDPKAVERVKEMVTSSLHNFAKKYDRREESTKSILEAETPEEVTEMIGPFWESSTDEEYEIETTTLLASPDADNRQEESTEKVREKTTENTPLLTQPKLRPVTVPVISHPFANTQLFSFTKPVTKHIQGPTPVIKWLPSGGYYVYYNLG